MKKTSILVMAAVLAAGATAAVAQSRDDTRSMHDADSTRSAPATPRTADNKLGHAMHRLGEKTRSAMHRMGNAMHAHRDTRDDSRAMGAQADHDVERERRERMDRAYANWKNRQPDARDGRVELDNGEHRDERGEAAR
ncbi:MULTISPECIES: hypothetical protein [Ramlibacter]|uniref:Uncharacterized protein n=1 Tax=Ramlibacter aquaticus TaxID=2780094 RepID=A0ABR9SI33_9BURK|nr:MULTISPECIES: hypothetical protein [Ramlibacter]MBE7941834.1 hypothetical protein [Ramlibacter aquaticus]